MSSTAGLRRWLLFYRWWLIGAAIPIAVASVSAALYSSTCQPPLFSVCRACLDPCAGQPIDPKNRAKITLIYTRLLLPTSARSVFYHEECGVDCTQWIRFDAPRADAIDFARRASAGPLHPGTDHLPIAGDDPVWWPGRFPNTAWSGIKTLQYGGYDQGVVIAATTSGARIWVLAREH